MLLVGLSASSLILSDSIEINIDWMKRLWKTVSQALWSFPPFLVGPLVIFYVGNSISKFFLVRTLFCMIVFELFRWGSKGTIHSYCYSGSPAIMRAWHRRWASLLRGVNRWRIRRVSGLGLCQLPEARNKRRTVQRQNANYLKQYCFGSFTWHCFRRASDHKGQRLQVLVYSDSEHRPI